MLQRHLVHGVERRSPILVEHIYIYIYICIYAAFLRVTHEMAVWEFFYLQDGGISESFTHKMAAWEICLQDGCVFESLEYILRLQCRIYLVNVT